MFRSNVAPTDTLKNQNALESVVKSPSDGAKNLNGETSVNVTASQTAQGKLDDVFKYSQNLFVTGRSKWVSSETNSAITNCLNPSKTTFKI